MIIVTMNTDMRSVIEKRLEKMPEAVNEVLKDAVNDTAKWARTRLANKAKQTYVVKTGSFNKNMKIKNATKSHAVAVITTKGSVMEIRDFKASPNSYAPSSERPEAVKGRVLKSSSAKALQKGTLKAFVARFKSGHVAVVQRVEQGKVPARSKLKDRYVKKLLGPSIPKMIGDEKRVYGIVEPEIQSTLRDYAYKHIAKKLEG